MPTAFTRDCVQARGDSFFKILDRARGLRVMARPCGELAIAHGAQLPAQRLLGDRDAELLEDRLCQIDEPPTHHAVDCRNSGLLSIMRAMAWRWTSLSLDGCPGDFPFSRPSGPRSLKCNTQSRMNLKLDTANHRRLSTRRAIINCRERQKPTRRAGLSFVFFAETMQLGRTKISAQWYRSRHDEPRVRHVDKSDSARIRECPIKVKFQDRISFNLHCHRVGQIIDVKVPLVVT